MLTLRMRSKLASPLAVYLDENIDGGALAPRPSSLDGKVVGLLPNWRLSAVGIVKTLGTLLEERCRPKAVVLERPWPQEQKVLEDKVSVREKLDDFARRVDVVIAASGD